MVMSMTGGVSRKTCSKSAVAAIERTAHQATTTTSTWMDSDSAAIFGPLVLIVIGILFLLVNSGRISARTLFVAFAQYWPALLILWPIVLYGWFLQSRGIEPDDLDFGDDD